MLQVAEMYLFYHEVGHLLQSKSPILLNEFTDEEIESGLFDIVDHVSEIDADFYASVRLPMHLFEICKRELRYKSIVLRTKYLEDLLIVTTVGYMIYRLLGFKNKDDFYLKKYSHPHPVVRMLNVFIRLVESSMQNTTLPVNKHRIIDLVMRVLEFYADNILELDKLKKFLVDGKENMDDIKLYIFELQEIVIRSPETAFYKTQNKTL